MFPVGIIIVSNFIVLMQIHFRIATIRIKIESPARCVCAPRCNNNHHHRLPSVARTKWKYIRKNNSYSHISVLFFCMNIFKYIWDSFKTKKIMPWDTFFCVLCYPFCPLHAHCSELSCRDKRSWPPNGTGCNRCSARWIVLHIWHLRIKFQKLWQ